MFFYLKYGGCLEPHTSSCGEKGANQLNRQLILRSENKLVFLGRVRIYQCSLSDYRYTVLTPQLIALMLVVSNSKWVSYVNWRGTALPSHSAMISTTVMTSEGHQHTVTYIRWAYLIMAIMPIVDGHYWTTDRLSFTNKLERMGTLQFTFWDHQHKELMAD